MYLTYYITVALRTNIATIVRNVNGYNIVCTCWLHEIRERRGYTYIYIYIIIIIIIVKKASRGGAEVADTYIAGNYKRAAWLADARAVSGLMKEKKLSPRFRDI